MTSVSSEVPLLTVRTAVDDSKDGATTLAPQRATGGDVLPPTSAPLQDPASVNSEPDDGEDEEDSNARPSVPWFANRGCGVTSVIIIVLIAVVLFPPVWLKLAA